MSIARSALAALLVLGAAVPAAPQAAAARPRKQYTIEQFMATTSLGGASFSPDESKILFSSNVTGIFNVYTVSVNGGEPKALTASTTDTTQAVAFFPADERVLFTRDQGGNELNHLYVRETDGQERDLTPGEKLKAVFQGFNRAGTAFYVLSNERDPRYFDLYRYDAKTYDRTLVYKDEVGYFFGDISDDGRWIAFGKVQTTSDSDVYLYDTTSKEMKHLTPHSGQVSNSVASFDPAGQALYYLTNEGGEFARVKRYVLEGGRYEEVEKAEWDVSYTTFSHDGRYRVTAVNEDGRTVIRLHDLKTGQLVALPKLPAADITVGHDLAQREAPGLLRQRRPLAQQPLRVHPGRRRAAPPHGEPQQGHRPRGPRGSRGRALQVVRRHGGPEHPVEAAPGHRRSGRRRPSSGFTAVRAARPARATARSSSTW